MGLVSPIDFIPLAEETGLIVEIGRWVLKTACSDYQCWQKQQNFPLILSVNLSIRQFQHPGLTQEIFQILEETGMNPHNLELEITESWMMQDVQGAIAILDKLNKAGIRIAIDDFGTGYSSLGKLKYLPINTLKIDKSFIDDLVNEGADLAIIQCIINLSKGLNLKVIAEGVETQEQLEKLQILGCDLGQGYWISPPIPSDEIMTFLSRYPSLRNKIQSFSPAIAIHQGELFSRLERTNLKPHQLSCTDHLIQIGNRLYFDHCLAKEWKRHQRSRVQLSLILCDIDYFKQFNDSYGHLGRDSCLQAIAEVMRSVVKRPTDLIARYGGEKFALILPDTDSPGALHLAQMIGAGVRKLEIPHYQSPQSIVTLSLGLATLIPRAELDWDFLISSAEQALYQAKDEGRDRRLTIRTSLVKDKANTVNVIN